MTWLAGLVLLSLAQSPPDSSYQNAGLRLLVSEVAGSNREVPGRLAGYSARVEAEAALMRTDADGRERVSSLQQLALRVSWSRDGTYSEHAFGERSLHRSLLRYDALKVPSFTVPVLYGNRLDLLTGPFGADESSSGGTPSGLQALHPLADDRERIYRFTGGDVTQRWMVGGRAITVVRIRAAPARVPEARTTVFDGDLFVDVERRQLIGMRGRIQEIGGLPNFLKRAAASMLEEVGHIEVIMAEFEGQYWLPITERLDLRLSSRLGRHEAITLRISSRFFDVSPDVRTTSDPLVVRAIPLVAAPRKISVAPADSLRAFSEWRRPLGESTAADEFAQLSGSFTIDAPVTSLRDLELGTRTFRETLRFNRIEGLFTGSGLSIPLPLLRGGGSLYLSGGRAWSEKTLRGRGDLEVAFGLWRAGVGGARSLDGTNDFTYVPYQAAPFLAALLSIDDYDYVDRRSATVHAERRSRSNALRFRAELARASDRSALRAIRYGLARADSGFRPNRPVTPGSYTRASARFELNPNVLAEYLQPGLGVSARTEIGRGDLNYERIESRISMHRVLPGSIALSVRADAGALFFRDRVPLQQLFELGGPAQLPGFDYKTVGGDRAALGQLRATWPLAALGGRPPSRRALRAHLSATFFVGIASSSSPLVDSAVTALRMGAPDCEPEVPCARAGRAHSSLQVGLRLFDGALFIGMARRVSQSDRWKLAVSAGVF